MSRTQRSEQPAAATESQIGILTLALRSSSRLVVIHLKYSNFKDEIVTAEGTGIGIGNATLTAVTGTNDGINTLQLNKVIEAPKIDSNLLSAIT